MISRGIGFWKDAKNQRLYLDWLGKQLGFVSFEDWYRLSHEDIIKNNGRGLLMHYNYSTSKTLLSVYPEYNWTIWKFKIVSRGFWTERTNQRLFFDWVGKELGFCSSEDWYTITNDDIFKYGGGRLLLKYKNSPLAALQAIYPEFRWQWWKFSNKPKGPWTDTKKAEEFLNVIAKRLQISQLDDWYRVSRKDLKTYRALHFVEKRGGLMKVLSQVYANHQWDKQKFRKQKKSSQWKLFKIIKDIIPSHLEVIEEFIVPFAHPIYLACLKFDVFVPALGLAFEYQGHHHYNDHYLFGPMDSYKERDLEKRNFCQSLGIALFEVPFWCKLDKRTIQDMLFKCRPDVISEPGKDSLHLSITFSTDEFMMN